MDFRCTSTCAACSTSRIRASSSTSIRPAEPRFFTPVGACRKWASSSSSPRSAGRSGGSSRPTRSRAVIGRPESRRRGSASIAATSRRRSAPSRSESAGSCARPIWPATAPGSRRRSGRRSPAGRSSGSRRGRRGRSSCRRSACSRRSICARSDTTPPGTFTSSPRRSSSRSPTVSSTTATGKTRSARSAICSCPRISKIGRR